MKLYIAQTWYEELGSPSSSPTNKIFVFDSEEKRNSFQQEWVKSNKHNTYSWLNDCFYSNKSKYWLEFIDTELNSIEAL